MAMTVTRCTATKCANCAKSAECLKTCLDLIVKKSFITDQRVKERNIIFKKKKNTTKVADYKV